MNYYGGTITVHGRKLITGLIAGETIEFTRIVVGSGEIPEGVEPIDMTDLVNPVALGTSSVPFVDNGVLYMTVEYRNDMNGGLQEGFWLREFGIYAKTESTDEVLFYYATLGDSPQPVNAYKDNRVDIRRYPISIAIATEADMEVKYAPGAFVTSQEVISIIKSELGKIMEAASASRIADITIPTTGWQEQSGDDDDFSLYIEIPVEGVTSSQYPSVAIARQSLKAAKEAGICPTVETIDGALLFFAANVPTEDIHATVTLISQSISHSSGTGGSESSYILPIATSTRLGGVKLGAGINSLPDGTISVDKGISNDEIASSDEVNEMLDDLFNS